MDIRNIKNELKNASVDTRAGIKLIKLTGDINTSVFAAEIKPKTMLNPHFHKKGIEIYQVLEGEGMMNVGEMKNNNIIWNNKFKVKQGDFFSIQEQKIHQIVNDSENPLVTVFTCPESHLGKDRFFVKDIGV